MLLDACDDAADDEADLPPDRLGRCLQHVMPNRSDALPGIATANGFSVTVIVDQLAIAERGRLRQQHANRYIDRLCHRDVAVHPDSHPHA
ncbi:hypothetical protein JCM33774_45970 [Actinophytocola sp. KF-1]